MTETKAPRPSIIGHTEIVIEREGLQADNGLVALHQTVRIWPHCKFSHKGIRMVRSYHVFLFFLPITFRNLLEEVFNLTNILKGAINRCKTNIGYLI